MSKLKWDKEGQHFYETGIKNVALYVKADSTETLDDAYNGFRAGVAWNGITNVSEKPTGAEATALYADDIKYLNLISAEELEASVEAYTYPDAFGECDGSKDLGNGVYIGQQTRKTFCLAYKTVLGNDTEGNDLGYKLHIIYNATAAPTEKAYATINDSPEAITFSWELKTTPVEVNSIANAKPTANIIIDSTKFTSDTDKAKLTAIEDALFGDDATTTGTIHDAHVLLPDDIYKILHPTVDPEDPENP